MRTALHRYTIAASYSRCAPSRAFFVVLLIKWSGSSLQLDWSKSKIFLVKNGNGNPANVKSDKRSGPNNSGPCTGLIYYARRCLVSQMWMSVLWVTEAAVHTLPALTLLEALPVPVLKDTTAMDSAAQVTLPQQIFPSLFAILISYKTR